MKEKKDVMDPKDFLKKAGQLHKLHSILKAPSVKAKRKEIDAKEAEDEKNFLSLSSKDRRKLSIHSMEDNDRYSTAATKLLHGKSEKRQMKGQQIFHTNNHNNNDNNNKTQDDDDDDDEDEDNESNKEALNCMFRQYRRASTENNVFSSASSSSQSVLHDSGDSNNRMHLASADSYISNASAMTSSTGGESSVGSFDGIGEGIAKKSYHRSRESYQPTLKGKNPIKSNYDQYDWPSMGQYESRPSSFDIEEMMYRKKQEKFPPFPTYSRIQYKRNLPLLPAEAPFPYPEGESIHHPNNNINQPQNQDSSSSRFVNFSSEYHNKEQHHHQGPAFPQSIEQFQKNFAAFQAQEQNSQRHTSAEEEQESTNYYSRQNNLQNHQLNAQQIQNNQRNTEGVSFCNDPGKHYLQGQHHQQQCQLLDGANQIKQQQAIIRQQHQQILEQYEYQQKLKYEQRLAHEQALLQKQQMQQIRPYQEQALEYQYSKANEYQKLLDQQIQLAKKLKQSQKLLSKSSTSHSGNNFNDSEERPMKNTMRKMSVSAIRSSYRQRAREEEKRKEEQIKAELQFKARASSINKQVELELKQQESGVYEQLALEANRLEIPEYKSLDLELKEQGKQYVIVNGLINRKWCMDTIYKTELSRDIRKYLTLDKVIVLCRAPIDNQIENEADSAFQNLTTIAGKAALGNKATDKLTREEKKKNQKERELECKNVLRGIYMLHIPYLKSDLIPAMNYDKSCRCYEMIMEPKEKRGLFS